MMTIVTRAVGAGALFLMTLSSEAYAVRQHRPAARMSCSEVRYYVAKYSASVAEMYARSHGASDAQIERARRCLASNEAVETGQRRSYTE
jgi:hypothetical protein